MSALKGREVRRFDLGQKLCAERLKKSFLFALAFGRIGRGLDALDAEGGTGGRELRGGVDLAVVDVDRARQTAAQDADLEDALHARQRFVEEKLRVRHQTAVVVNEAEQMRAALLARRVRVGQPGADQRVALPQLVDVLAFEATVGFWILAQQAAGLAAPAQVGRERVRVERLAELHFGVTLQEFDQRLGGAGRLR